MPSGLYSFNFENSTSFLTLPAYVSSMQYGSIEIFCPLGHILSEILKHFTSWGIETF